MLDTVWKDIRFGIRILGRSPVFVLTAALSLAIGIGANATIFSIASGLLLRPLPGIADPGRLVDIGRTDNGGGFDTVSYPNYRDIRERARSTQGLYAYRVEPLAMSLRGDHDAERIYGGLVSGNYFSVLGARAQAGRLFIDADEAPGRNNVVVIGDLLWRRRFGADPSLAGRTITLSGQPYAVVGVAPVGFQGTTILRSDVWLPLTARPAGSDGPDMLTDRRLTWLMMGGRLAPGVRVTQADAELRAIGEGLARAYPATNAHKGLTVSRAASFPGRSDVIGAFLGVLMMIVGLVLLIACVNLAGMLLARGEGRRREIAVRLAIGAGRIRLIRQLLTETLLLFAGGCALALLVGRWLTRLLLSLLPELPVPISVPIGLDWRVVLFTVVLTLAAALLCGLAPALQASSLNLVPSLRTDAQEWRAGRMRLRHTFMVGQIALSLMLVISGGLLVRALDHALSIDPGFDQTHVDVVTLDLSLAGYTDATSVRFGRELVNRTRGLPGVQSAVMSADLPLDGDRMGIGNIELPGATTQPHPDPSWNVVSPGFFRTLAVRLLRGRDFTEADTAGAPGVAIVNEVLGRQLWGPASPLGRMIRIVNPIAGSAVNATIVGVAANAQMDTLGDSNAPYIYVPFAQNPRSHISLLVKSAGGGLVPQLRALVREMNPNLPATEAMPLSQVTALTLVPQRLAAAVAGCLGIVGLLLAAIGIYGVTTYTVTRRTREIGIRLALGADRASVLRLIVRQAGSLTTLGLVLGLAAGAAGAQVLRSLLFGVSTLDPVAFGSAALLFGLVSLAASYLPARHAARVDPMVALRAE